MDPIIYIEISEDISKVVAKIKRHKSDRLILVFPKGAIITNSPAHLNLLKRHADMLGKQIGIVSSDAKARQRAEHAGFEAAGPDAINSRPAAAKREKAAPQKPQAPKTQHPEQPVARPQAKPAEQQHFIPVPEQPAIPPKLIAANLKMPRFGIRKIKISRRKLIYGLSAVLLACLLAFILIPSATITVYPAMQPISKNFDVTVDQNIKTADFKQLIVQGVMVSAPEQLSKTYNSTGKQNVGIKATGSVKIYNSTGQTLRLRAATTTLTSGGMVYHLNQDVSGIRGVSAEVGITADQPGDQYNVPAGTKFEIHNAALGAGISSIYAQNDVAITSGASRFTAIVSQQDLDQAAADLKASVLQAAKQQLLNSRNLILVDNGSNLQVQSLTYDKKAGDNASTFTASLSGQLQALTFDATIIKKMIEQRAGLTITPDQYFVLSQKEQMDYSYKNVDYNKGAGDLNVAFNSLVADNIDTGSLKNSITGKNADQVKSILMQNSAIGSVNVHFSPFWVHTTPFWPSRVKIQISLNPAT
ncbi:baseplate J/gp47 family protein [Patescibacteria group bacterium]|nr:baseplate J/gp47 family protein [Patescibacteria group bacterium]